MIKMERIEKIKWFKHRLITAQMENGLHNYKIAMDIVIDALKEILDEL